MKKIFALSAIAATLLLASCYKDTGNNINNNYVNNSNLTFWMAANCSNTPVTVTVDGQSSQITQYYPVQQPGCAAVGCASFHVPPGTYTYTAAGSDSTWQGTVTVPSAGCRLQQIQCVMGNVTFWVDSAANNIKVTLTGWSSSYITADFPTSTPTCGSSGCANFTLPTGTYTYTAITAANVGYSGSVTISNDSCKLVKLY